jgi:hypothetical protein
MRKIEDHEIGATPARTGSLERSFWLDSSFSINPSVWRDAGSSSDEDAIFQFSEKLM